MSLPLGAARLTRDYLSGDPYASKSLKALEKYVQESLSKFIPKTLKAHDANHFVATSKTFRTLARITANWYGDNPKFLEKNSLEKAIPRLAEMTDKARADLPGVSNSRARQIVAGAVVAFSVMVELEVDEVEICPWALREGIVLRRLDWLSN